MSDENPRSRIRPIVWGDLRRMKPLSDTWGIDRGGPVDRYYIEKFLERNRTDISGSVLEVKDAWYTERFGVGVTRSDVLDVNPTNASATIVADLTAADAIPTETFDCIVLTQTLHQIFDFRSALRHTFRILKTGGVLLCTLPSVSRIDSHYEGGGYPESDYWRFTGDAVRRLFGEFAAEDSFSIDGFGNVLACAAFLYGLSPEELSRDELDLHDPWFALIYGVRAVKRRSGRR